MLNNCGGGWTPWGTILTVEENFHQYFANLDGLASDDPRKAIHTRYGIPWPRASACGSGSTRGTTWPRSRMSYFVMAGSSRPIRTTRPLRRPSGPRSAASSTRLRRAWWPRTARSWPTWATTSASTTSTSSSATGPTTRMTVRPTWTCSTRGRSTSPGSTTTAPACGCRWSTARDRSPRRTASPRRRTC